MVEVAVAYNFDGWLINIENKIEASSTRSLFQEPEIFFVREGGRGRDWKRSRVEQSSVQVQAASNNPLEGPE